MKKIFSVLLVLVALAPLAWGQEQMTASRFRKIVVKPGDSLPINAKIAALGPLWTNATMVVSVVYNTGKTFKEEARETVKTVEGKYLVTTLYAEFYKQPMHSIMVYDEKTTSFKVWALYGDNITEAQIVYDPQKRISAMNSTYADGYSEIGVSSYSDTERSSHTLVFRNGILVCTRDSRTTCAKN